MHPHNRPERAVAAGLGDSRALEEVERVAAGADEQEAGAERALAAGGEITDVEAPEGRLAEAGRGWRRLGGGWRLAVEADDFVVEVEGDPGSPLKSFEEAARERAEVHVGALLDARGGDGNGGVATVHHERDPVGDLPAVLAVRHVPEARRGDELPVIAH